MLPVSQRTVATGLMFSESNRDEFRDIRIFKRPERDIVKEG